MRANAIPRLASVIAGGSRGPTDGTDDRGGTERDGGTAESDGSSASRTGRRRFLGGVAVAAVGASTGCLTFESASTTETREFEVDGELTVENTEGDLTVRSDDGDSVVAELTKHDDFGNEDALSKVTLESDRSNGDLSLSVVDRADDGFVHGTSADLAVTVPESVAVSAVEANDGDVAVSEVSGDPDVTVDDGDVRVVGPGGDLTLTVDDGDAIVEGAGGSVDITGEDGDVRVDGADGTATIEVEDGDVEVGGVGGVDQVRAEDGDVDLSLEAIGSDGVVEADAGDVTVSLSAAVDGRVVARTDDGDIATDGLDADITRESEGSYVEADFGGEGSRLLVNTDSGDIELVGRE